MRILGFVDSIASMGFFKSMLIRVKKYVENYFFKVRYIFVYDFEEVVSDDVKFYNMGAFEESLCLSNVDSQLCQHLGKRLGDPAWSLFLYNENDSVLGYGFIHAPKSTEWNDSLPTKNSEARISSLYVYPCYRGRGLIVKINRAQVVHAKTNNRKAWSVIESSNIASLRAASKIACVSRTNYLVKFFRRNVFSILTNPFEVYFLWGKRRARR